MTFDPDPNKVIPISVAGAVNALKAAYAEPSVKRFVLTSSSSAVLPSCEEAYLEGRVVTETSWSEDAVNLAWAPPPYTPNRSSNVYAASKVEAEQAIWKYHEANQASRPDLVVNAGKLHRPGDLEVCGD
jgi:nucleoside-diphosphate-sugar epimerase